MSSVAVPASTPRRVFRVLRWAVLLVAALLLLPYLLTPLYLFARPVSTVMLWRWMTGARVERSYVPIDAMAAGLPITVIASEDGRFCGHRGVDWRGLREAFEGADTWSDARGGSTITQQVAKNLFLWQGRNFVRKALELPLALWIDLILPKRRIMEIYLNIAEWGPDGQFGAEAGARLAFNKPAAGLNGREAALMAAVLPSPRRRSARQPGPGLRRLAGIYEKRARVAAAGCLRLARRP